MLKWIVAAALLAGSASPAFAQDGLRFIDLTGDFDRFATSTATMADTARVKAFEKQMGPLAEGFYLRSRKPEKYDERVLKNLQAYPESREGILKVSRQFAALFAPARKSFEEAFGPVASEQPVYLLHSLGEMDGGTRDLNGKDTLLFGADGIFKYHGDNDLTPFFHHELFHVYHEPLMKDCDAVWCSLWEEGLATYVASSLNPGAGEGALLLDIPAPIKPAVDANRAAAICATLPLLNSEKEEDYEPLFYGSKNLPGFPARMGYYIGYLVAADLGKTRSLKELAALTPEQAKPLIDQSLASMATCPDKAAGERG